MPTERQYAVEGIQIDEQLNAFEFAVEGVQVNETVAAAATDSGVIIRTRSASPVTPSYKSGYASSASESAYPNLWRGLVAAYVPYLGSSGTTVKDIAIGNADGTLSGIDQTAWTMTDKGLVIDCNSNGGWLCGTDTKILAEEKPLTIVALTYQDSADTTRFWYKIATRNPGTSTGWVISSIGTGMRFYVDYDSTDLSRLQHANSAPTADKWQHVAVTWDGSTNSTGIKFYVEGKDGNLFSSGSNAAGSFVDHSANELAIGRDQSASSRYWPGKLGPILFYDRVLSLDEIRQLHATDNLAPFRLRRRVPLYTAADAAPGGLSIPIAAYHYNHHLRA